ncbi:MAG: hypothetical protein K2N73_11010 [Lachnospiraceae bacterium]|nr:hypothetical protein [Lachnospiraceae bacterium]
MKIDNRKREDIISEIKALSDSYTPEWKFDDAQPDAASVIGIIFSEQMAENISKLNQVPDKYHAAFANMYGLSLRPAIPAKTVCTIKVAEGIQGGTYLAKGTQVMGLTDAGEEVLFAFSHGINAVNTELTDIIQASVSEKRVAACSPHSFSMFSVQGRSLHRQAVMMHFRNFPDTRKQKVRLRFRGNLTSLHMAKLFADRAYFTLSYLTDAKGEQRAFDYVKNVGELVEIGNIEKVPSIEKNGERMTVLMLEMTEPVQENIVLQSIELFGENCALRPDFIWNGRNEVRADSETFCPFTEQPALYDECFIGQDFLLRQPGAVAILDFELDFGRYTPKMDSIAEQDLRIIKRRPQENAARRYYECSIQEVTFEYFNGRGWRRLDASMDLSALFSREENAGKYHVAFSVPDDWESIVQGGYEGNCIRMQAVRVDNCYMPEVTYIYPILSQVSLYTQEQEHGMMPNTVTVIKGAGTAAAVWSGLNHGGVDAFSLFPYQGDYVYWGFNRSLGKGTVSLFVELDSGMAAPDYSGLKLSFSYSSANVGSFKPLKVIDGTNAFQNSGILMFVPPPDMAECEVEGVRRYWIRIEDSDRKFAADRHNVPVVRSVHMNAVMVENVVIKEEQDYYIESVAPDMRFPLYADNILSAQVWVNERDRLSLEEMDSLMADSDIETKAEYNSLGEIEDFYVLWHETDSFVNAAHMERCYCIDRGRNELVFGDGADVRIPQNTQSAAFRVRAVCCDGERANVRANTISRFQGTVIAVEAITNPIDAYGAVNPEEVRDALIRGNTLLSSRKRMVTEQDYVREALTFSSAIDQAVCIAGQAGITLVLLMKDFKLGDYSFRSIQDSLKWHLTGICETTCGKSGILVRQPVFVKISMDIWLHVPDMTKSMAVKQQWVDKITDFLEPVKADGRAGWKIGKLPGIRQIRLMLSTLERTADIAHIHILAEYMDNHRMHRMSLDRVRINPFMVCCNGTHTINIMGD